MKVYRKWLVLGRVNGKSGIFASFNTKKGAEEAMELAGFKRLGQNLWSDSNDNKFFIDKNVKEFG